MIIDTHAHLYAEEFKDDVNDTISRAFKADVQKILMPCLNHDSLDGMLSLSRNFPETCFPMLGLHPCEVGPNFLNTLSELFKWIDKEKFYAIGEIGMDLYREVKFKDEQQEAFKVQIQRAINYQLPVVIHSRQANFEVIKIIKELKNNELKGVFHCFSGTLEEAEEIIDMGFYLGIGGVVTFKNSGLDKIIENIGYEHIILETDAPYLAPVPFRGKRNEPSYLSYVIKKVSELCKAEIDIIADKTSENAQTLFNLP